MCHHFAAPNKGAPLGTLLCNSRIFIWAEPLTGVRWSPVAAGCRNCECLLALSFR
jgi:hypothetical protein